MPDYSKGKIYAIRSHQTEQIYIGSTTQTLAQRLGKHRSCYKVYKNGKRRYMTSYEMLQYDDHYIELLELCECICKAELHRREGQLIRERNNCVNKCVPGRTQQETKIREREWRNNNKVKIALNKREHYQKNKQKICKKVKEWTKQNQEKVNSNKRVYYQKNKEKFKVNRRDHYQKNKELVRKRNDEYYQKNKEKVDEYRKQKIKCECGSDTSITNLARHRKSQKHLRFLGLLNTAQ